jgi:Domain of unknown function (DUF202)
VDALDSDVTRRTRLAAERTWLAWWRSGIAASTAAVADTRGAAHRHRRGDRRVERDHGQHREADPQEDGREDGAAAEAAPQAGAVGDRVGEHQHDDHTGGACRDERRQRGLTREQDVARIGAQQVGHQREQADRQAAADEQGGQRHPAPISTPASISSMPAGRGPPKIAEIAEEDPAVESTAGCVDRAARDARPPRRPPIRARSGAPRGPAPRRS